MNDTIAESTSLGVDIKRKESIGKGARKPEFSREMCKNTGKNGKKYVDIRISFQDELCYSDSELSRHVFIIIGFN